MGECGISNGNEEELMDDEYVNVRVNEENRCSCFAVKIPRLDDEVGKEQIRVAELHLDDKTSFREAIRLQIQTRIQNNEYKHAVDQLKSARDLVKLKRKEIDSHLSVIRLGKNALSFDDNFQQQLEAQEYLKTLKKELDSLKASVIRAENAAAVAQRKNHDQEKEVKQLEARFRDANDACQAAYAHLRYLRTQHRDKMRHFFGYRDEATAATNYAYSRIKCDRLCKNQVERFMKMWNKNSMFRQDYVNSNAKSTVRRFGTLDGSSLGPDEQPHMLPHVVNMENREDNEQGTSGKDVSNEAEAEPQIGAELKAQMEAEKRDKKRHKRLRLKERKKAAARLGTSENSQDHHHQMEEKIEQVSENGTSEASPLSDNLQQEDVEVIMQAEETEGNLQQRDVEVIMQAEETKGNLQQGDVEVTMQAEETEGNLQQRDVEVIMQAEETKGNLQQGDVEVTMQAEETKRKEGEDGLKEHVQLQGLTEADQRQKKRQKKLRKKERNKAAREGRSGVDQTQTPEVQNRNPQVTHHHEPYVTSNPEMQSDAADEKRDQNQQVMNQETHEPNYATLTHDHDPKEEEVTIHDPKEEKEEEEKKEEQEEVTIHDPKEEEEEEKKEEEEGEEEVTMQVEDTEVIEQPREALMAQMRAEIKAQLEAEIRDKKREKKLRRKERNKERKEAAASGKTFIWVVIIFILITLILCLTHFHFNVTTIRWS